MNKNQMQRRLNSTYDDKIGRDPKRDKAIVDAPISHGMTRQTKGEIGFHGGVAVDDLPNVPLKSYEKPISIHGGMTKQQVDKFHSTAANHPTVILQDAANLGRPPKRPRPAEKA